VELFKRLTGEAALCAEACHFDADDDLFDVLCDSSPDATFFVPSAHRLRVNDFDWGGKFQPAADYCQPAQLRNGQASEADVTAQGRIPARSGGAIESVSGWMATGLPQMAEDTVLPEDGGEGWSRSD
jgi:hypothetical protein